MFNQKEYMKNYMKNYWHTHPEQYKRQKIRAQKNNKNWRILYPEKSKEHNKKIKAEIHKLLGDRCVNPFNLNHGDFLNDSRCLQIDHINGGGYRELKRLKTQWAYYKYILEQIKNGSKEYQLLCSNCNWIKRFKNNELN